MEDYKKIVPAIVNQHSYPGSVYVKHAMDYIAHHYREKSKSVNWQIISESTEATLPAVLKRQSVVHHRNIW